MLFPVIIVVWKIFHFIFMIESEKNWRGWISFNACSILRVALLKRFLQNVKFDRRYYCSLLERRVSSKLFFRIVLSTVSRLPISIEETNDCFNIRSLRMVNVK